MKIRGLFDSGLRHFRYSSPVYGTREKPAQIKYSFHCLGGADSVIQLRTKVTEYFKNVETNRYSIALSEKPSLAAEGLKRHSIEVILTPRHPGDDLTILRPEDYDMLLEWERAALELPERVKETSLI
ncbi:MAG: hypothetical protein COT74_00175 [Bdellovibrionales bacterium CG10_big_fil_rev_8_21_14_0_10_45_34]|nr:MAG: hypothetical protein COT74_00175 [Bdellovibrionales bacterium CG10_big_fil_rev_8_21_14_0_10_45_34]